MFINKIFLRIHSDAKLTNDPFRVTYEINKRNLSLTAKRVEVNALSTRSDHLK